MGMIKTVECDVCSGIQHDRDRYKMLEQHPAIHSFTVERRVGSGCSEVNQIEEYKVHLCSECARTAYEYLGSMLEEKSKKKFTCYRGLGHPRTI